MLHRFASIYQQFRPNLTVFLFQTPSNIHILYKDHQAHLGSSCPLATRAQYLNIKQSPAPKKWRNAIIVKPKFIS